jgi:hypothetical protein
VATFGRAPRSPTLFFGRDAELERLSIQLTRVRLALVYGVGGVGKTAFLLRAGERLSTELGLPFLYVECRDGESASTMARAALAQLGPNDTAGMPPVEQLVRTGGFVLVLDDAHLADPNGILDAAEYLATHNDRIRVCIGSRTTLPLSPVAIDHLVVKLGGLHAEEASALWSALEELYGPRPPSPGLAGGNPLLIKRAFADLEADPARDPLGLAALDELTRGILVELSALRQPGKREWLQMGRDAAAVAEALSGLERRFLIEADSDARYRVHALIREAVTASPMAANAAVHARCVLAYRDAEDSEPRLVELIHHAARAGEDQLLQDLLAHESSQLRRIPPGSTVLDREIADAIDRLGARITLGRDLLLLRARVRGRQGQIERAWKELLALPAEASGPPTSDKAEVSHMLGLFEVSVQAAREVLADPAASPVDVLLAFGYEAEAERALGNTEALLRLLGGGSQLDSLGPLAPGVRAWLEAVYAMDTERYADAAAQLALARSTLLSLLPATALPILVSLERTVRVYLGSDVPLAEDAGELFDDSAYFRCVARLLRAEEYLALGRVEKAAELALSTLTYGEALHSIGVTSFAAWIWAEAACSLGDFDRVLERVPEHLRAAVDARHLPPRLRLELALVQAFWFTGNVEAARELARELEPRAIAYPRIRARAARFAGVSVELSLSGFARTEDSVLEADAALARGELEIAERLGRAAVAESARFGWSELLAKAGLTLAEHALARADIDSAERHLESCRTPIEAGSFGPPRVQLAALRAGLARARGEVAARLTSDQLESEFLEARDRERSWARALFLRACRRLGLDEPASIELVSERRSLHLPATGRQAWRVEAELVIDVIGARATIGNRELDLSRKKAALDLFVALVSSSAGWLSPAELAASAWQLDYHAVRHHSRVAMAVARLRELIGPDWIDSGREGYRFKHPKSWFVLKPLG